jgi:Ca2+-binding RTX toxin-like protein
MLAGGGGNDVLRGETGNDILAGNGGYDTFQLDFYWDDRTMDGADELRQPMTEANDIIKDFARGEDRLAITYMVVEPGADDDVTESGAISFTNLDTNQDGRFGSGDAGVAIENVTFDGIARASLVFDVSVVPMTYHHATGTIALYNVTSLSAGDIA